MKVKVNIGSYIDSPQWWKNFVNNHSSMKTGNNTVGKVMQHLHSVLEAQGFKWESPDPYRPYSILVAPSEEELTMFILRWS